MCSRDGIFFGGDSAFGPKNIIWAVAHGHEAAISIHKHCQGESLKDRLPDGVNLASQKMGMHEWSYSNDYDPAARRLMPHVDLKERFKKLDIEVELGFTAEQAIQEVERCLNCDIQTVFAAKLCIECDACIDICPVNCLTIAENGDEADLRTRLSAPAENLEQALYVPKICHRRAASWSRMRTSAFIAAFARNAAQRVHGTCRSRQYCCRTRATKPPVSNRMLRRRPPNRVLTWPQSTTSSLK